MRGTKLDFIFQNALLTFTIGLAFLIGRLYKSEPVMFISLLILLLISTIVISYLYLQWRKRSVDLLLTHTKAVVDNRNAVSIDESGLQEYKETIKLINQLQSDLTKGEQQRNQMVADVAHELRTPISIFKGQLESILEGATPLKRETLLPLLDETSRMTKLIQDLRQLSLAETGHLKLERSWVPFDKMIAEIVAILILEAEEKGVSLKIIGETNCEVYCDLPRLKQVFINLIGNAIRFSKAGGSVQVKLSKLNDSVSIKIKDSGQGIPIENLPYIFQRFYRVEESRSRDYGGMGLGLAIAKEFIAAHGGEIKVDSELGVGTSFFISLPIFPLS